jgi:hypothetical protein
VAATGDLFAPQVIGTPTITHEAGPVEMLSPDGNVKTVQGRHVGTMQALGYQTVTPEIRQQLDDKARLGGTVGEMAAAGLGFARGASLGLSDLAIRGGENVGILPEGTTEDVRKLKEINPTASLGGELTSFIAPGLGAVKALGTAGKVAKGLGAAQAAVGGVGQALGKAAGKIAGQQLGKYAAPAVRMAAESAIFQAGQNLSENVLENKELTAEAVLANTGEAAILGAGLGFGIPAALRGAQKATTAALDSRPVRWIADKAGSQFAKFLDPQHALRLYSGAEGRSALLGTTPKAEKFKRGVETLYKEGAYGAGALDIEDATGKILNVGGGGLLNREAMAGRFAGFEKKFMGLIEDTIDKADDAARAKGVKPAAFGVSNAEADALLDKVIKAQSSSRINTAQEKVIFESLANDLANIQAKDSFRGLLEIKRGLDQSRINWDVQTVGKVAAEITKDVRRLVAKKIEAGMGEVAPELVGRWQQSNKMVGALIDVGDALSKQINRADANANILGVRWRDAATGLLSGGVLGGPAGLAVAIGNKAVQSDQGLLARAFMGERLASLGWLQKATNAAQGNIAKSVSQFLKGVDAAAIGGAVTRPPQIAGAIASSDAFTPDMRQKTDQEWFAGVSGQIARVAADPETFAEDQAARLGALAEHAPQTTDAIVSKQLQIYSYLSQVMPKNPAKTVSLFAPNWRPSEHEINEFRDIVRVTRKPLSILQDLQHGTATRAQTKAVQALYPTLYQQMLDQVREQVSEPGASLPYDKELRLGMLFPGAVPSMSAEKTLKMSTKPPEEQEQPRGGGYLAGGAGKMKTGTRTSTKLDALSER